MNVRVTDTEEIACYTCGYSIPKKLTGRCRDCRGSEYSCLCGDNTTGWHRYSCTVVPDENEDDDPLLPRSTRSPEEAAWEDKRIGDMDDLTLAQRSWCDSMLDDWAARYIVVRRAIEDQLSTNDPQGK